LNTASTNVIEVHVAKWGRESIHYHREFQSIQLPHSRTLMVYLPPEYDLQPQRRFPVFYLHDGQNLFDASTAFGGVAWKCDELAERSSRAGDTEPVILVGIGNTQDRIHEYGPLEMRPGPWDLARAYGRFVTTEVKNFIDREYRTLSDPEHTAVGGSSMGGLISLYLCRWYPRIFGKCMAMSPSLWWDRDVFLRTFSGNTEWLASCRIWLDLGGREGSNSTAQRNQLRRARKLAQLLERSNLTAEQYQFFEDLEAGHDEHAWSARFPHALKFLYPTV
jgi:predicted alpha/beta superfamily hydrolase